MTRLRVVVGAPETNEADRWVKSMNCPDDGVVVATTPENGARSGLGTRLLSALGKVHGLPGESDTYAQDATWAEAWLYALSPEEVILYRAHLLTPSALAWLSELADRLEVRIWVIANLAICPSSDARDCLRRLPAIRWGAFVEARTPPRSLRPSRRQRPAEPIPWDRALLDVAAPFYLASLSLLDDAVAARLRSVFRSSLLRADDFFLAGADPTEAELVRWLGGEMAHKPLDEQLAVLRANQCAGLMSRRNLEVAVHTALTRLPGAAVRPEFKGDLAALFLRYRSPLVPAFMAVAMHPAVGPEQALNMTSSDLLEDKGRWSVLVEGCGFELPVEAARALYAYDYWRETQPARVEGPLWLSPASNPISSLTIRKMTSALSLATGAPLWSLYRLNSTRWDKRYGVNLRVIA